MKVAILTIQTVISGMTKAIKNTYIAPGPEKEMNTDAMNLYFSPVFKIGKMANIRAKIHTQTTSLRAAVFAE